MALSPVRGAALASLSRSLSYDWQPYLYSKSSPRQSLLSNPFPLYGLKVARRATIIAQCVTSRMSFLNSHTQIQALSETRSCGRRVRYEPHSDSYGPRSYAGHGKLLARGSEEFSNIAPRKVSPGRAGSSSKWPLAGCHSVEGATTSECRDASLSQRNLWSRGSEWTPFARDRAHWNSQEWCKGALPSPVMQPIPFQQHWTKRGHLQNVGRPKVNVRSGNGGSANASMEAVRVKTLRRGLMLEIERDQNKNILVVVQRPDGRKNWMTTDQNGTSISIRPQQVNYIVPSSQEYTPADINVFLQNVEAIEDASLLELVWSEMSAENRSLKAEELAELLYMDNGPVECYAAHRLLSMDRIYFRRRKGVDLAFEPRPIQQVEELKSKLDAEEAVRAENQRFVDAMRSFMTNKPGMDPLRWQHDPIVAPALEALRPYALELQGYEKKLAEKYLEMLGVPRLPDAARRLLVRMGVLPRHLNMEVLRSDVLQPFSDEVFNAAKNIVANLPADADEAIRVDLTQLKVYTIDSEDTDEIDDGLSVERLGDGRLRVWIHVADPARWIGPHDALDREAQRRGTSVYLCTGKMTMFPPEMACGPMSLFQGQRCCAMSVSADLMPDGRLGDFQVVNSYIIPTYRLSYEDVGDMLSAAIKEEPELAMLDQAASLRHEMRMSSGGIEISLPESDIKVLNPEADEPEIIMSVVNQNARPRRLVSEMMVLCGEVIARFGGERGLALPYRGQPTPDFPELWEMQGVPKGHCTSVYLRRFMTRSEINCSLPIPHASLALNGYVQFTSPIRRYGDMLAHYQVKAFLRGEKTPYSSDAMEIVMTGVGMRMKEARRLEKGVERYWMLEYLRRQSQDTVMSAVVLRWIRDGESLISILIAKIGFETVMRATRKMKLGEMLDVVVIEADPQRDILRIQEADPYRCAKFDETDQKQAAAVTVNGSLEVEPLASCEDATQSHKDSAAVVATSEADSPNSSIDSSIDSSVSGSVISADDVLVSGERRTSLGSKAEDLVDQAVELAGENGSSEGSVGNGESGGRTVERGETTSLSS